ncbi:uncharacterized protein C10orf143 homolog [Anomaloglossus baeobatrachus]|uniref:uncharacterized protein C10orf143 homolog n=1 Tax=Anomaloglossus baeobatrachus TaxID=238106 RepID=UPI003F5008A3
MGGRRLLTRRHCTARRSGSHQPALTTRPCGRIPAANMEICEDMAVDLNVVNLRKRQCMDAAMDHSLNKRTCQGLESYAHGDLLNDYDMVYWQAEVAPGVKEPVDGFIPNGGTQQHCMPLQNSQTLTPQICLRCMAGESGHINHILRH